MREGQQTVTVVGAGISGLSVAYGLAQHGMRVRVLESSARCGGLIETRRNNGIQVESSASMLLSGHRATEQLISALSLTNQVQRRQRHAQRRYLVHQGSLHPFIASPWGVWRLPLWSPKGRLHLLTEPFRRVGNSESESAGEFIRRRLGREAMELLFEPFISAVMASDPENCSAQSLLPRLTTLEQRYGSLTLGWLRHILFSKGSPEPFSFHHGISTLTDALANSGEFELYLKHPVHKIERESGDWRVVTRHLGEEQRWQSQHLVIATPGREAANLMEPVDPDVAKRVRSIRYQPVTVLHQLYQRDAIAHPLDGSGFLVPQREGRSINGVQWMSEIFSGRASAGTTLCSSYIGGARTPHLCGQSQDELNRLATADLHHYCGVNGNGSDAMQWSEVVRHSLGLPQYSLEHSRIVAEVQRGLARTPGLYLHGNYLDGIGVRDRIGSSERLVQQIVGAITKNSVQPLTSATRVEGGGVRAIFPVR